MHKFSFLGFEIEELKYRIVDETKKEKDTNLSFGYGIDKSTNSDTVYKLVLGVTLEHAFKGKDSTLEMDVKISGLFKFENSEITENEAKEMLKVNGSAILFPYVRTLIQSLTSYDCNNEKVMLPAINMAEVIKDIDEQYEKKR